MPEKVQIHVSGLTMYAKCPEQYRRRYIEGEKIAPGVALVVGQSTHTAIAADLNAKKDSGALLPDEAVATAARDAVANLWEQGVTLQDGDTQGDAIDQAVSLASLHHAEVAPTITPIHVERPWVLDVNGLNVQLAGTIDIQQPDEMNDTKTAGKSPGEDEAEKSLQLTTYALALHAHDGKIPARLHLNYLVKTKKPKVVTLTTTRTPEDFVPLLARVAVVARAIETGIFPPAPPDAWWCSERFCGYHASCPYVRHGRSVQVG